jgi:hypothetical protein
VAGNRKGFNPITTTHVLWADFRLAKQQLTKTIKKQLITAKREHASKFALSYAPWRAAVKQFWIVMARSNSAAHSQN